MIRRMLYALDRWVVRHERYRPVGDGGYICHIRIARYRRVPLVLADGTVVNPGDPIVELHLDNLAAAALNQGGKGGLRFRREMLRMMPALARDLSSRPEYRDICAVGAATVFSSSSRLVAMLGFEFRPLPAYTRWWLGTWERILLANYHHEGRRRLRRVRQGALQHIWISRRALLRYLDADGPAEHTGAPRVPVRRETV